MDVERIRDFEELQKIKDEWDSLLSLSNQKCVFLTHEWFSSWWKCLSEDNSLEILVFKDEKGSFIGIAPFMFKDRILRFIGSQEVSDYCDFIVAEGREEEFYEFFFEYLGEIYPDLKTVELINVKSSSPTLDFSTRLGSKHNYACSFSEIEVAPVLDLPFSYESYFKSLNKKIRHELRRKLRRVESLEGTKIHKVTDAEEVLSSIGTFIALHKKSTPLKSEFWEKAGMSDFFREMVRQFSLKSWVELVFLNYGEKIMAALLNFSYRDEISFYNVAFDQDFSRYSPGIYLFASSIKKAISERKKSVNFLRGREKYKYDFGAKESRIFQLILTPGVVTG